MDRAIWTRIFKAALLLEVWIGETALRHHHVEGEVSTLRFTPSCSFKDPLKAERRRLENCNQINECTGRCLHGKSRHAHRETKAVHLDCRLQLTE